MPQEDRLFKVVDKATNKFIMVAHYTTISGVFKMYAEGVRRMLRETENGGSCDFHMNGREHVPWQVVTITEWKGTI